MKEIREVLQDKWDFKDSGKDLEYFKEGFNEELIHSLSEDKKEPEWMLEIRLKALAEFHKRPIPTWCIPDLSKINFDEMTYYIKTKQDKVPNNWEDVPEEIKNTFEKIGIPEAERKQLAGAITQYESNAVYANLQQEWVDQGVIFTDLNTAVKEHEELVKQYFGKCVPYFDNKFSALHYSVWSGGSFCYVPKGVKVTKPMQNYFRMNAMKEGQFEHTLLVAEENSKLLYLEGCSSPKYTKASLHSAVVEIFVKDNAHCRYTTVQNWSKNTYNCLTGDTKIYTANKGIVDLKDVVVGDLVFALDSEDMVIKERKIINTWIKGKQKVFKIKLSNGSEIKATADHPILSFDTNEKKLVWKKVRELTNGDIVWASKKIPATKEICFNLKITKPRTGWLKYTQYPVIADKNTMWLFGLYLGDGSLGYYKENRKYLSVVYSVPRNESIHNQMIQNVNTYFKVPPCVRKDGVCTTFSSSVFAKFIQEFGFGGNAHSKRIPEWVYSTSLENRLSFLGGLIDSDGHITKDGYVAQIINCNKKLLEDIRYLALSVDLGASSIIQRDYSSTRKELWIKNVKTKASESYILKLSNIQILKPYLRKPESQEKVKVLKVKNRLVRANNYNIFKEGYGIKSDYVGIVAITAIEEAGVEEVFDIEVEELHNFVANGIIVKNCNTKRSIVGKNAFMEWVGGSLGSMTSMLYPCSILKGEGARADHLNITIAGSGCIKEGGAKVIHAASNTQSKIIAKSISLNGGVSVYRGLVRINSGAKGCKSNVRCDALMTDDFSKSDTFPIVEINENDVQFSHEASVGKITDDQLFYLMSRGFTEDEAVNTIVLGFVEPVLKEIPLEYAVELNRLIQLEMTNSIG